MCFFFLIEAVVRCATGSAACEARQKVDARDHARSTLIATWQTTRMNFMKESDEVCETKQVISSLKASNPNPNLSYTHRFPCCMNFMLHDASLEARKLAGTTVLMLYQKLLTCKNKLMNWWKWWWVRMNFMILLTTILWGWRRRWRQQWWWQCSRGRWKWRKWR